MLCLWLQVEMLQEFVKAECIEETQADFTLYADCYDIDIRAVTVAAHGWKVR